MLISTPDGFIASNTDGADQVGGRRRVRHQHDQEIGLRRRLVELGARQDRVEVRRLAAAVADADDAHAERLAFVRQVFRDRADADDHGGAARPAGSARPGSSGAPPGSRTGRGNRA